jgi:hypothetical protein
MIRILTTNIELSQCPDLRKWFTHIVVAAAIIQTLDSLHLKYPEVGPDKLKELAEGRAALVK